MKNAFNFVSRHSLLDQCAIHFPLLLPWTEWCYSQHPFLWHSMGTLTSEAGVQQGDPLGPFCFTLVLHHLVLIIAKDDSCQDLLFNAWYLDDGGGGWSIFLCPTCGTSSGFRFLTGASFKSTKM